MTYLALSGLAKSYAGLPVYSGIDLAVEKGRIAVLVGPSGCGKTTLLRTIAGLVTADAGSIRLDGTEISGLLPKDRGIGMVFQNYALFPNMNVRHNLAFGLEQKGLDRASIARRVDAMLALVNLVDHADKRPAKLSGGQQQRVALARALVLEPKLLLLDEPLSALDAEIRKRLRDELRRLQRETGFTAILVTHDQDEALTLGDTIAVMRAGRIEQSGTPLEVYGHPRNRAVARFIGDFNVLEPDEIGRIFNIGSTAAWAIHPEAVVLDTATIEAAGQPVLVAGGRVDTIQMMGPLIRYQILLGSVRLKVSQINRPGQALVPVGANVTVTVRRQDVRVLEE